MERVMAHQIMTHISGANKVVELYWTATAWRGCPSPTLQGKVWCPVPSLKSVTPGDMYHTSITSSPMQRIIRVHKGFITSSLY
jgi:hypothetical protein